MSLPLDQVLQQAVICHQAGQLREAERLYRAVLQAQPHQPDANYHLGLLAMQAQQVDAALIHFKTALDANPAQQRYWLVYLDALLKAGQTELAGRVLALGREGGLAGSEVDALAERLAARHAVNQQEMEALLALFHLGRYAEMESQASKLIGQHPDSGVCWKALGAALLQQGKYLEALSALQQAAALLPGDVGIQTNLASTFQALGQLAEVEACYRRILLISPDNIEAQFYLAKAQQRQGQLAEAEAGFRHILTIKPEHTDALLALAKVLWKQQRLLEAESSLRQLLETQPDCVKAWLMLGSILQERGKPVKAATCFRQVLTLQPENAVAYCNLGVALQAQGCVQDAEASFRTALQFSPNDAETHSNLATSLIEQGRFDEGEASLRRALQLKPSFVDAHTNLIFARDMMVGLSPAEIQEERKRWSKAHAEPIARYSNYANRPDPERRLRIGYVSADMRKHSAAKVFSAMLLNFNRSDFEVIAYSNNNKEDQITAAIRQNVTHWRNIVGMSDSAVAELIRQDAIDILVDLSGHTDGNRLLVFARKPAPLQITAWGYGCGTGMSAMDVLFADAVVIPPQEKALYAEEVRYLPNSVVYCAADEFPDVNELPALTGKTITFGSHNRLAKVSDQAYQAWAQILIAVPNSRILWKTPGLDDAETRKRVIERFARLAIDPQRISLFGKTVWHEHMLTFNQVDITLDAFPQSGGVTTLEGLIMGVPMVALRWPTFNGRVSASILTTLGLTDWIAETPEQYVALAIQKAQDLAALSRLRQQLRSIITASIIGDVAAYVGIAEQEYRQLWREWCSRQ